MEKLNVKLSRSNYKTCKIISSILCYLIRDLTPEGRWNGENLGLVLNYLLDSIKYWSYKEQSCAPLCITSWLQLRLLHFISIRQFFSIYFSLFPCFDSLLPSSESILVKVKSDQVCWLGDCIVNQTYVWSI